MEARRELQDILRQARALLARPGNSFFWSSWADTSAALAEMDQRIAALERGELPPRLSLAVLFAPTGPIQEVSIDSGWPDEFLALSVRFDDAMALVYA